MHKSTYLAIHLFHKAERRRRSLDVAESELLEAVKQIPIEDMNQYVSITNQVIDKAEE